MVLHSQNKLKFQTSSIIILHQASISYSHKHFSDFLKDKNQNYFFHSPANKYEIQNIFSLNSNKSAVPNSIPTRILELLKNDISAQLANIFKACVCYFLSNFYFFTKC